MRTGTQTLQAEDRQFFSAHGEQDIAVQNQRYRHVARPLLAVEQEVGMQVNFIVVLDVEARARLQVGQVAVSYTHLRAHETVLDLVCRLLLEKKKKIDS